MEGRVLAIGTELPPQALVQSVALVVPADDRLRAFILALKSLMILAGIGAGWLPDRFPISHSQTRSSLVKTSRTWVPPLLFRFCGYEVGADRVRVVLANISGFTHPLQA
jgi:hypothetical protein